jgi:CheY-like chemotaxis protein
MRTILFVDDEEDTVLIFSLLLSASGYRVDSARDGEEALRKIGASPPDVLVTDWSMPGMDGARLCATLRSPGSQFAGTPIIVISATDLSVDNERAPYDAALHKPFSADELLREIEKVMRSSPSQRREAG